MGNSEVGHLNMGSGRIVYQEISRISNAIEDGSFFTNPELLHAIDFARQHQGAVHLMGLLSDGGVHSHTEHIYALLDLCKSQGMNRVYLHCFLDGRDVGPKTGAGFIAELQQKLNNLGWGEIATVGGRYYGMDRDKHWDRIEQAYLAMVKAQGHKAANAFAAVESSYNDRVYDEFMEPTIIIDEKGQAVGTVQDGDSIIFFNFRADRARQITRAFVDEDMPYFKRGPRPKVHFLCMTQYDVTIQAPVAFPPQNLNHTLGEILARHNLRQLRIAETEKYAHVTFFFNGGVEKPNPGEERVLIPSPTVATYNLKPEMSAAEITDRVIEELRRDYYDVVIMNYANADMVGHTGILDAAIKAVQTVDQCLQRVVAEVLQLQGTILVTADHGNAEMMVCPQTGNPFTAHTTEKVPFILVGEEFIGQKLREGGSLRDIAPTMLGLLGLDIPEEMTGQSLMEPKK